MSPQELQDLIERILREHEIVVDLGSGQVPIIIKFKKRTAAGR